jgi:hypothetical protein
MRYIPTEAGGMVRLILVLLAALFLGAPVMAQVNYALLIGA